MLRKSGQSEVEIDLGAFTDPSSIVLAGRPRGKNCRAVSDLDYHDSRESIEVRIVVPERIRSVNSSFFLGMLGPSIRSLGEDNFRKRYQLVGEHVREAFEYCILVASTSETALSDS